LKKVLGALVAVLVLGVLGYVFIEDMDLGNAFFSAVLVMSTTGSPLGLSTAGKIFTATLILATLSLAIIGLSKILNPKEEEMQTLTDFSVPGGDESMMMEFKVGKALAGMKKQEILENHGAIVIGVKHRGGFDINIPLNFKLVSGSSVLMMGSPAALIKIGKL
jgi:hypothetical protein